MTNKNNSKRYRLHSAIRKQGFELATKLKTVYQNIDEPPVKQSKQLQKTLNKWDFHQLF